MINHIYLKQIIPVSCNLEREKNVSHLCDGESDQIWDFRKAVQEQWQYWHRLETFGV